LTVFPKNRKKQPFVIYSRCDSHQLRKRLLSA
jgi:hypothetical protein